MSWIDDTPITWLPAEPCTLTLTADAAFDSDDLARFAKLGGIVKRNGRRVFCAGTIIIAGNGTGGIAP